jgi:hypothetical protein
MESSFGLIVLAVIVFLLHNSQDTADGSGEIADEVAGAAIGAASSVAGAVNDAVEVVMALSKSQVQQIIRDAAAANGVDPALMLAIAKQESGFNPANINRMDPSYGLFQIQTFWLTHFGFANDYRQLLDAQFAADLAAKILLYFQSRINPQTKDFFEFPAEVDIYNVGETAWAKGHRNLPYRDSVLNYYRSFGGVA